MAKAVSLTVHRNRLEKRRRREREKDMVSAAKSMARDNDLAAYAVVAITKDGKGLACWDTGASIPMWAFPGAVYRILDHDLGAHQEDEDFRAPLKDD